MDDFSVQSEITDTLTVLSKRKLELTEERSNIKNELKNIKDNVLHIQELLSDKNVKKSDNEAIDDLSNKMEFVNRKLNVIELKIRLNETLIRHEETMLKNKSRFVEDEHPTKIPKEGRKKKERRKSIVDSPEAKSAGFYKDEITKDILPISSSRVIIVSLDHNNDEWEGTVYKALGNLHIPKNVHIFSESLHNNLGRLENISFEDNHIYKTMQFLNTYLCISSFIDISYSTLRTHGISQRFGFMEIPRSFYFITLALMANFVDFGDKKAIIRKENGNTKFMAAIEKRISRLNKRMMRERRKQKMISLDFSEDDINQENIILMRNVLEKLKSGRYEKLYNKMYDLTQKVPEEELTSKAMVHNKKVLDKEANLIYSVILLLIDKDGFDKREEYENNLALLKSLYEKSLKYNNAAADGDKKSIPKLKFVYNEALNIYVENMKIVINMRDQITLSKLYKLNVKEGVNRFILLVGGGHSNGLASKMSKNEEWIIKRVPSIFTKDNMIYLLSQIINLSGGPTSKKGLDPSLLKSPDPKMFPSLSVINEDDIFIF